MPQYIEITCISLIKDERDPNRKHRCNRYLGDLNAEAKDGHFRCPRKECKKIWHVTNDVSRGTLIYRQLEEDETREYLSNVIKIEARHLDGDEPARNTEGAG